MTFGCVVPAQDSQSGIEAGLRVASKRREERDTGRN